jgi:sarcosine oxidase
MSAGRRVAVFGAGAFGGWTALELVRRGARVTLLDAWGAGHTRASSGGETRVIRATYGSRDIYTRMAKQALRKWQAYERVQGVRFYHRTGALWMFGEDDGFGQASARTLREHDIPLEAWTVSDAAVRYPQIDFAGVRRVLFEPDAGYLLARRACDHVARQVVAEGGDYRIAAAASPARIDGARVAGVTLADGSTLEADAFVFACGPWLPALFPDVIGERITVTKQEIYYFGTPAGDARFDDPALPVWLDFAEEGLYGIPGHDGRGFKLANDEAGPAFEPTSGSRAVGQQGVDAARRFLARRFPTLADAPLVASEVCQYESTPDADFLIDRHPHAPHVWLAGGGSGHGFKMGPAVGELLASLVLGESQPEPSFLLRRFDQPPNGGWRPKWSA